MIKIQNNEIEVLDPKMQGEGAEAKNGPLVKKFLLNVPPSSRSHHFLLQ